MTATIEDYALIGDGRSCALVSRSGSIDFLCWPRFDSDCCLAALLGDERNGHWLIAPDDAVRQSIRRYRGDTPVLETQHVTANGRVRVIDFMPWSDAPSSIIRIVEGLAGDVPMTCRLKLRFGFGSVRPWKQAHDRGFIFEVGPDRVSFDCPVGAVADPDDVTAHFVIAPGERLVFVLSYSASTSSLEPPVDVDAAVRDTEQTWQQWIGHFGPRGPWDATIRRSLMTLRLLTDRHSGGLVAAATFGLPEVDGGSDNWDYRYCWLRDSTFVLTALLNAGLHEEAKRWRYWMLRAVAGDPASMQTVYRIDGGRFLHEWECDWLPGYRGATPVRIGNVAWAQTQIDIFGELMDSFDVLAKAGIPRTARVIEVELAIVQHLERAWRQPGSGLWESRGEPRCYTYSQVMAWVGISRFVAAHEGEPDIDAALMDRLRSLREVIHRSVCERSFHHDLGHFVCYQGGDALDASLLLLPLVGFLPVDDERVAATIAAIERLQMREGLVSRKPPRSNGPDEGAFLVCSCWLADCYKLQGREQEARALLERVISVANDLGLLSEEYDVRRGRLSGNFPQALTHLGLINTALSLSGPVIQRAGG